MASNLVAVSVERGEKCIREFIAMKKKEYEELWKQKDENWYKSLQIIPGM